MRYRIFFLSLFAFVRLSAQQAGQYVFRHIDQSDGLLHNNVLGMRQDTRGYIWIRTPSGLQRYDGSRFVNLHSILDNPVTGPVGGGELYFDSTRNEMWLAGSTQMQKLSLATNVFTNYSWQQFQTGPASGTEKYFAGDSTVWLLNDKMFFQYQRNDGNYVAVLDASFGRAGESGGSLYDRLNQQIWIRAGEGLVMLDKRTHRMYDAKFNPLHNPLLEQFSSCHRVARFIMMDRHQNIWISTWDDRFFRFDPVTRKLNEYSLAAIKGRQSELDKATETLLVDAMFEDKSGTVWIATENAGLLRYLPAKNNFEATEVGTKGGSPVEFNEKIYCILQDKNENLWLGTDQGISIFNPSKQFFRSLRHRINQPSVAKAEITRMHQCSNGDLLIGTWGGGFSVYDSLWNFRRNIVVPGSLDFNMAWCFINREDGKVWIGCQHGYLHTYDPATGKVQSMCPPEMGKSTIRCMARDNDGNIWFGLHDGRIVEWNRSDSAFHGYGDSIRKDKWMPTVINIFIDDINNFWVATEKGLRRFDPRQRRFVQTWLPDPGNPKSISAISIQAIAPLDDSTLLLGTIFGGIDIFSKKAGSFTHIGMDEGLPSNSVYSIKKSSDGFVWFTTDYNLYRFKPGNKNFIRYNFYPGTVNSGFVADGFYPLRDGSWATTTGTEMIAFQPASDSITEEPEQVNISGFRIYDSLIFIDSFLFKRRPVELNSRQNFITVQYASLNFAKLHQSRYYYRLSGVNDDWVYAGNRNFASYTNLPPGKYVFSVRAGAESDNSPFSSLAIIIRPAFWQTWWFRMLCVLVAVLVIWLLVRRRVRAIRYEGEMNQKMIESKMVALRAQMNPHFIFNCLNSIDNLIQLDEKEKATLYLSKFARLIRATLEHSGQPSVPCWKDMETLELYLELESLRFDNKFAWKLNIAGEILQGDYKVPPLIIQPFVENAIHHGLLNKIDDNKQLLVDVTVTGSHIHFVIEDNGVGRETANRYKKMNASAHQSMGLQITKDRINLFNRSEHDSVVITDLLNERMEPVGTKVNIELLNLS